MSAISSDSAAPPRTSAPAEAWHLAFRNAFIVLGGCDEATFRTYACLYGVANYGGEPVPNVPSDVAWMSVIQKALSGIFIFLFGLGLRNMLKMN